MKKLITLGLAAALAASSGYALASDIDLGGAANAAGNASVGLGHALKAGGSVGADVKAGAKLDAKSDSSMAVADNSASAGASTETYGSVISTLKTMDTDSIDLNAVSDEGNITLVMLSDLKGKADANANALDQALSANADAETTLHAKIADNQAIMDKLEANQLTADSVVAVDTTADGAVTLYIDDRG